MASYSPYGTSHSFQTTPPTPTKASASTPNSQQGEPAVEKIRRHPHYYLIGGDVHFLVENYLFRVHRYFFERESAFFREKLAIPAVAGQTAKGSSDTNPFSLEDVQAIDFSRFLWVFYNPKYSIYDAQIEDWSAILKLAFDWRFAEVKQLACRELEKFAIDPVQKIDLYQRYELDRKLLIPSYSALTFRPEPLSVKEGRQLGLETALLLAEAREYARGKLAANGARSPSSADLDQDHMTDIISKVFGINMSAPMSAPDESNDVFGIATASPSRPSASARTATNGSHSRQQSRNLSRAPSPPPLNTNLRSIAQALASAAPANVPEPPVVAAGDPSAEASTQGQNVATADSTGTNPVPSEGQRDTNQTGQAVTSSPHSSVLQQLISGSISQEEHPTRKVQLAPLEIPKIPQTAVHQTQGQPLPPKEKRTGSQLGVELGVEVGAAAQAQAGNAHEDLKNIITTTIPVVNTPLNPSHDVTNTFERNPTRQNENSKKGADAATMTVRSKEPKTNDDAADEENCLPDGQAVGGNELDLIPALTETEAASREMQENGKVADESRGNTVGDNEVNQGENGQQEQQIEVQLEVNAGAGDGVGAVNGDGKPQPNGESTHNGSAGDLDASGSDIWVNT